MYNLARLSFLLLASSFFLFHTSDALALQLERQITPPTTSAPGQGGGGATTSAPSSSPTSTPTSTPPSTSTPSPQTTSTPLIVISQQSSAPPTTTQQTTNAPATTSTAPTTTEQQQVTTPTGGSSTPPTVGTQTLTQTDSSSSSSSGSSTTTAAPSSSTTATSSGLGTGSIIGMSVAGGVAVIGVVAFFIWKFTRKRFADFDDNEAIKWPELNSHGGENVNAHAMPTHATGRAGFGDDTESTVHGGYASSVGATSASELYPGGAPDPYAVPPLPHLNPNQPYHDEPENGFYDPYRGPVPNAFNDVGVDHTGQYGPDAIPMTQMARTRSPAPQMALDAGGRHSPHPSMGRMSPGPQASLGRQSPGPQMAYGNQMVEAPGRQSSPGPRAAYGAYDGAR